MNLEELYAYLDGELAPEEEARVRRALQDDPSAAALLERLQAADRALDELPGLEASPGFTARVLAAARHRARGRLVRLLAPVAAAAALLLAVLGTGGGETAPEEIFSTQEHLEYVWETDAETFGSLAFTELDDAILAELEAS